MTYPYPKTIKEAAEVLDKAKPGWANIINTYSLDMEKPSKCILGQLYFSYSNGVGKLFYGHAVNVNDGVFGTIASKSDWIKEINNRRSIEMTFLEALEAMNEGKKVVYIDSGYNTRVLEKRDNTIWDAKESDRTGKNECIFVFWDKKFKLYETKPTFKDVKIGQKFTLKASGAQFLRITTTCHGLNVLNTETYTTGVLLNSDEVTDIQGE